MRVASLNGNPNLAPHAAFSFLHAKGDHLKLLLPLVFAAAVLSSPALAEGTARLTLDDIVGDWSAEDLSLSEVYSCDTPVRISFTTEPSLALVITAPDWTSTLQKRDGKNGQIELYDSKTGTTRITAERYMEEVLLFSFNGGRFNGKALAMAPCY